MYDLAEYLAMVEDRVRTPAYLAAMRAVIRPGDVVLELGTGFGYFAVQACRLGAGHVFAIEPDDAIALGPALAAAHGCADRITFIQDVSERVTLPRRADLLLEDLRGMSALYAGRLGALGDATARLLQPGARRIPRLDRLWCAPATRGEVGVEADAAGSVVGGVGGGTDGAFDGVDLGIVRDRIARDLQRIRTDRDATALAAGAVWATIDLAMPGDRSRRGRVECPIERDGTVDGVLSWFSTELADGIGFDTGPGGPRTVYDRALLPLADPIAVRRGDVLAIAVDAVHDGADYVWSWKVGGRGTDGRPLPDSAGTTLGARLMSAQRRARREASYRPAFTERVREMRALLEAVDGSASLDAIAATLARRFPSRFPDVREAMRWAGERLAALDEPSA